MAHVFISYSHKDADFIDILMPQLEDASMDYWIDNHRLRAGEDWRQGIDRAIRSSFAMIAILSPDAVGSMYVTYEWSFALGIGIHVIPILLETAKLHPRLEALQFLDFCSPENYSWNRLLEILVEERDKPHNRGNFDSRVVELIEQVNGNDVTQREIAIRRLGSLKAKSAVPALVEHRNPLPEVVV